jgi:hypothetical protein
MTGLSSNTSIYVDFYIYQKYIQQLNWGWGGGGGLVVNGSQLLLLNPKMVVLRLISGLRQCFLIIMTPVPVKLDWSTMAHFSEVF